MNLPHPRGEPDPTPDALTGDAAGPHLVPGPEVVRELRDRAAEHFRQGHGDDPAWRAAVVAAEITRWAHDRATRGLPAIDEANERRLGHAVLAALSGLGGLHSLLERDDVENIHVHGHDRVFLEFADGSLQRCHEPVADSDTELLDLLAALFSQHGQTAREFSPAQPLGTVWLPAGGPLGSRMAAMRSVTHRPRVNIRRHRLAHATLGDLRERGTLDGRLQEFLHTCVAAGVNLLVTGAPFAGKTTLLRALCQEIPRTEHVVTVEDDLELGLHLDDARLVTAAEARTANAEGAGEITLDALLKQALRHSPSRLVLGEVRGGEITALLRALGNGAVGGMGTLHATSARAVPDRIAALGQLADPPLPIEAAHRWSASALDLIVHITRTDDPRTGNRQRVVTEIVEVGGLGDAATPDLTTLFTPSTPGGRGVAVQPPSTGLRARLEQQGFDWDFLDYPDHTRPWDG